MLYNIFLICFFFIIFRLVTFVVIDRQRIMVMSLLNTIHGYAEPAFTFWEKVLIYIWILVIPKRAKAMHFNLRLGMKVRSAYEKAYCNDSKERS